MGDENISETFLNRYKSLNNSVSYDKYDMDNLLLKLNELIKCTNAINMLNYSTYDYILNPLQKLNLLKMMT